MAKKRTGLDALREYEARSGRQTQSEAQTEGSSGGAWRSGLDALRQFEANGGGRNVKNGEFNPNYRTMTRAMYESAYERYKRAAEAQERYSRAADAVGSSQVGGYLMAMQQRQPQGRAAKTIDHDQQSGYRRTREVKSAQVQPTIDHDQQSGYLRTMQLKGSPEYLEQPEDQEWETVRQDQARGGKRTQYELQRQIEQLERARDYVLSMQAGDPEGLPELRGAYEAVNAGRTKPMTLTEMDEALREMKVRKQNAATLADEAMTAQELERKKDAIYALAFYPEEWTPEQKQAARGILETQRGGSGIFGGMDRASYAFAPYIEAVRSGDMDRADEWEQIYNMLYSRLFEKTTAVTEGFAEGLGLRSAEKVIGAATGAENPAWEAYMRSVQVAKAQNPALSAGGQIAGSLALMGGISKGVGAASGALLGTKAAQLGTLGRTALSMGQSALTFAAREAIQGAGAAVTGEKTGGAYAQDILASGAGGAAGALVSGLISTNMADWLRRTGNSKPFWEFVRQSASAYAFSGTSVATSAMLGSEKKSANEIATELGTAFLFSLVSGYMNTMRETKMASAAVEQKYETISQQLDAIGKHLDGGGKFRTEEEFTQAVEDLRRTVQGLKADVRGTYYAGQQDFVDQMVAALDRIDYNLLSMLPGADAGTAAASAASTAAAGAGGVTAAEAQKLMQEASAALAEGTQGVPSAPVQPGDAGGKGAAAAAQALTEGMTPEQTRKMIQDDFGTTAAQDAAWREGTEEQEAAFQAYSRYAEERDRLEQERRGLETERRTVQYGQQETGSRNGEGRTESVYSGGQSRGMGEGSEIERTLERQGEAVRLRNRAKDLGAENISPAEAGLKGGDTTKSLLKVPEAAYGAHEKALQKAVEARGASLNIVMGRIRLANGTAVDEFIDTETRQVTVRADCTKWAMDNLIDHALFHGLSTEQRNATAQAVADRFSESELMAIAGQYVKRMRGVYEGMSEKELLNTAMEEVLADAAGRMLRYTDADATKFTETVRGIIDWNGKTDAGEGSQRFSYAGEFARTADKETLERAKQMIDGGASAEAIFRETGWFKGADGQWRFEIDDSKMEFRRDGDARLMEEAPYRRMQELSDKWAASFEKGGEELTEAENTELEALQDQYVDRVWEEKYELQDFLKHDDLYRAYPKLRHMSLIFRPMSIEDYGYYSPKDGAIVMNSDLIGAPEKTLIHEIQHIIQSMEGFARGASPKYWNDRMEEGVSKKNAAGEEMLPNELYRNTAGEIEARDVAARRNMSADERRARMPDTGNADTVFAEARWQTAMDYDPETARIREQTQDEITAEYQNTVHGILNGTINSKEALLVGYTPDIYRKLGMPDLPFVVGSGHVYSMAKTASEASADGKFQKGTHYHGLGERVVADIMEFVRDPVMVISAKDVDAKTEPMRSTHSVVALIDVGTHGKALVIPVSITAERSVDGARMDVNAISSAYEKKASALVKEAVAQFNVGENSVFYVKKEAADLLGAGVRFPEQLKAATSSDGIVRKFGTKVNMSIENVTQSQQFKRWFGDWQNKPETASKVVNADGTPKVVYHQTGNDFTIFDVRKNGAGTRDNETPFGIFLKSSSRDIGLNGKKQMALYANIRNPLYAQDRADLTRQLRKLSPEYDAIRQEHAALDKEYKQKFEDAKRNFISFLTEWKKNHPGESSRSLYGTPEFERVFDAEDAVVEEWTGKADALSVRAKEVLTDALKQAGYDGVILANDAGSWGRSTDAYIALNKNQVKSATDNVGTFDRDNPDIRYSVAEDAPETETSAEKAKWTAAEGTPIFNFDAKYDFAYGADPNPFYRMIGITPPGLRIGIEAQATRAADKIENGKAYAKALLDFATKPDRSTKTLTLNFPNADGTYRSENVQNTKIMQDIYKYYAEAVPEENRHSEAEFWMWRRRIAEGSVSSRIETMSAEAKAQAWQESARADFKSTGALEKMGVKVERSIGRYGRTQSLIETEKAYKQAKREVNRAIDRLAATPKEIAFARQIADGVFDMRDIPRGYDRRVVLSLVDYMNAEAALGNDRILAQRKAIRQETADTVEALFSDSADNKVSGMFTLNHRTAQRNMLHIFGDETGQKLNRAIFDPIQRNEAERIRFINKQFDDVRTFEDSTGKKSELTHVESILVQLVMEGKATVALLGDMPGSPAISKAGMKIADGMKPNAAAKSEHLNKNEKQLAKMYASWVSALRMMADGKIDTVKIDNAAKVYTQKYNEFYAAINDFLVAHGYEPIGFIQNYAPHMQAEETRTALDSALKMLGINEDVVTLPTSIAGLTADFKPNKRWNPYFLHRTGETYNFDVAKGFESYVAYMSELFYHTDDIMTVRALSDYLRRRYSPDDISFDIDKYTWLRERMPDEQLLYLQQRGKLEHGAIVDSEQLDSMIDDELTALYENAKNKSKYSNLVVWLDNYANVLAGKQTKGDRSTEEDFGRKTLTIGNKLTRGFGAAKVAGNIATIFNQTAQIPTILAEKGLRNTAAAIKDMVTGQLRKADFTLESDYLTSKKGVHFLVTDEKNMYEWALDKVGQAQEFADAMVSTIAVRAAYLEGIQKGMSHKQAMRYADQYGAQVMGDRSKGAKPVAFNSKNPVMQLINTFQLEVANSWEHVTQDTAGFDFREMARKFGKDKAVKALAGIIVKLLLATYIWNRISDETYGGTPAPYDVLGITSNFIAGGYGLSINDAMKTVMDNGWEKVTGERLFGTEDKDRSFNVWKAIEAAGGDIANDIPYLQNASAMIGWGDNTLPAAIPTKALDNMINAVKGGKGAKDIAKAAFDVGTEIAPGGSQIKKTARGIDAMVRGGVYQGYGDQTKLRYPVDNKNIGKWIQAVVFGPNGLSETGRYYAGEERAIGEKQTTAYQAMIAAGADKEESYRLIRRITKLGDDEDSKLDKLNMLLSSKVSTAGQGAYYYIMMAGDKERERIDALTGEDGVIGMDDYLRAAQKKLQIDADEAMRPAEKADAFRQWVNQKGYSAEQKRGVLDAFKFSQIIMVGGGHSELYQAALEGVSEYDALRADAIATEKADGKSQAQAESSVNSGLRSQMKQDYLDGLVDDETASAFLKEYTGADDDDVFWALEEWNGGKDWKKYGKFFDAVEKGVTADTRKVAKYYMEHGVDKGTLSSQLTTYFKERWLAASGDEAARLKRAYISAYKAIGGDGDKARDNMIKWRQEANKKRRENK